MSKRGFTLVELVATIAVLGLVVSIGGYSIVKVMESSRKENYKLLIGNIKDGAEAYYQECRYSKGSIEAIFKGDMAKVNEFCSGATGGSISLGKLVRYGYLKGNAKNGSDEYALENPTDEKIINDCLINVSYSGGKILITTVANSSNSNEASCPSTY